MRSLRKPILLLFLMPFVVSAFGQETAGVNTSENTGAVIKGKAPVAKDLLKIRFPKPKFFKLSNGLSVYVLEDHRAPLVRFSLRLKAGAIYETKPGVANITAAMLTEGTSSRSYTQLAGDLDAIGASLNASATQDLTIVSASGLTEATPKLVEIMSDALRHPTFPLDRLDRVKFRERSAISQRMSNPTSIVSELTMQVFYGGTHYASLSPNRKDIDGLTQDDLKGFYSTNYVPDGAILGITGDVRVSDLTALLESGLGKWKRSGSPVQTPVAKFVPKTAHIYLVDRPGSAQSVLQFGTLSITQTDPDYIAVVVANRILGGGSSGRLFQNIREKKGYTYGAYSTILGRKWQAVWGANASVRTAVTEPAVGEFYKEFLRLQTEAVSEPELINAKRSIIGGFALTLENPQTILDRTLDQVQNGLPTDYWDTYAKKIDSVTVNDVQRVAKKYLGSGQIQLLVVGERKQIEAGLAKYGPIEIVDPTKIATVGTVAE